MASQTVRLLKREKTDTALPTLIDLFIASKQVEGRSPKTLTWYRANLIGFAKFAASEEPAKLSDLSVNLARSFIAELQSRTSRYDDHTLRPQKSGGLSASTVRGYARTLKVFGNWLSEEGFTNTNVFGRLKSPKVPETVIEVLSENEINQLIKAINPNSFLGARLNVVVLLLLDTGIRASELCTLTMSNTFLEDGYVKVMGKGSKERMVPFGATTRKAIMRYIHMFKPKPARDDIDALILSIEGTPLTYLGLSQALRRLGETANVPRLHAHLFRHTFAVRYLMNGGDIMSLRLILGHTTLEVTQVYLHLSQAHIQVQHHKFSPVDQLTLGNRRKRQ